MAPRRAPDLPPRLVRAKSLLSSVTLKADPAATTLSAFLLAASLTGCAAPAKLAELVVRGDSREISIRVKGSPPNSPGKPAVLFLALDGVDRAIMYDMLRKGEMPNLAFLFGGEEHGRFPHAYFEPSFISTLPSSTMTAWATAMTGVVPARHGVAGNEFFIRESRRLGAPAPASFPDSKPSLAIYTDGYLNSLVKAPTVYERMRATDPNVLIWVAMHQIFAGADRLLLARPTVIATAFEEFVGEHLEQAARAGKKTQSRKLYEKIDNDVIDVVKDALEKGPLPDVLTVYLSGTDLYAHIAEEGPEPARRVYLREVVDPAIGRLTAALRARDALKDRYVVLTSDHGHTQVVYDDAHAISTTSDNGLPALMKKAGYRVRPFKIDVSEKDDFSAVLTEGGAMAYLYVADRSTCAKAKDVCDWTKAPRFEEDVVPLAEALYTNNKDGALSPSMKETLDLILTRRPKPHDEDDLPFEVYVGAGKTVPVDEYLKEHPHSTYVEVQSRLRDLAVGPYGEHAGDILLLAHNGDRATPAERFYFAARYHSWHGSPSRTDSDIPLIVAHPNQTSEALQVRVSHVLGDEPRQQKVTDLLLELRSGK